MGWIGLVYLLLGAVLRPTDAQFAVPEPVMSCCEGDILLMLDSSGSIMSYEFQYMVNFLSMLLRPFSLGRGHVRVGLLQVDTKPNLEFGLDAYSTQTDLQGALKRTRQLHGDTNTEMALQQARGLLATPEGGAELPKVLLWLTDGVQPGDVDGPMAVLRREGVAILIVSVGHGNYQVLRRVVTPPIEDHLYFVDIDDINIITEDLRNAIIELLKAERLRVVQVSSQRAVLQWRPVLSAATGYYELRYGPASGASGQPLPHRRTLPGDTSSVELTDLLPQTSYTASLTPESNQEYLNTLRVTFTTTPDVAPPKGRSPAVVSVSEAGPDRVRVSWGPLQPDGVQRYQVEYGAIPSGPVRTLSLPRHQNSTLLTGLQPDTSYLVTVSTVDSSGKESAMSVRACTLEELPALADLQLTPVGRGEAEVQWQGRGAGLKGYWVSWESGGAQGSSPTASSVRYLPAGALSTRLTHLGPRSRVCVAPVYASGRGEGLCCTHSDTAYWGNE